MSEQSPDYAALLVRAQGNRFHREPTFGHGVDGARECWECTEQRTLLLRVIPSGSDHPQDGPR